ncbi:hypothetical protein OHC33_002912 [Knufia fluminis]|uniref:Uncharacterized protein n=1 Tax=Knufia fluminis TaxID=191047 RepID=A0AAN8FDH1_9EURO|nr:hypothetical protein OHC33_002912 [Knufia fluminis]
MTARRGRRSRTPLYNTLSAYPQQQIVDTTEQRQISQTINVDGAAQHLDIEQTKKTRQITNDSWSAAATVIRRDSFSRTRNEDDEDFLMDEDEQAEEGDDRDSVVTQIRVEEDVIMAD